MHKPLKDFQVSCSNCNLDAICLPRGLTRQEIDNLSIVVTNNAVLQKGEYIYRQGDAFKSLVAIKSGSAKLVSSDSEGNQHLINVLLPGELIGFDGLYQDIYSCSVIALETTNYCALPADKFTELYTKIPNAARELFKHSSEIINEYQNRIVTNTYSAEAKIALFLINLSDRLKKRGLSPLEFDILLTRQEIGQHLGLTLETVSRMLKQFQDMELIIVQRKQIQIKNLQALRDKYLG